MVKHKILQGGKHAGLPGDSTLELLRIVNAIIENVRAIKRSSDTGSKYVQSVR